MPDWNDVYSQKNIEAATPADVLVDNAHLLSAANMTGATGKALDYASGLTGNGLYLAKKGYHVSAWDLSDIAVEKINQFSEINNLTLSAQVRDLENEVADKNAEDKRSENSSNEFDVIVVSYFLHRDTLRNLYDLLNKGGLLFYQTFSGEQYCGQGPAREEYRLKKNELLSVFSDMQILFYREDDLDSSGVNSSPIAGQNVSPNARPNARPGMTYFVAKK